MGFFHIQTSRNKFVGGTLRKEGMMYQPHKVVVSLSKYQDLKCRSPKEKAYLRSIIIYI